MRAEVTKRAGFGERRAKQIPLLIFVLLTWGFPRLGLSASKSGAQMKNGFDLQGSLVPLKEIHHGGPPRDGIPALDQPRFSPAASATYLKPEDRVLGIELNGIVKAYPIRILDWHEIANDDFNGVPVVVTYCPLCGTGLAFSAEVAGSRKSFGVSGLLYNSDVLLYDRQTESLWSQLLGRAITGPLKGTSLKLIPLRHTTWRAWKEEHPDTQVLSIRTGHSRNYLGTAYRGYAKSRSVMFPVSHRDRRYHPKERVVGIEVDGRFKAYPFVELARTSGVIHDTVNGRKIKVVFDAENASALVLDTADKELPSVIGFWFAWTAFHPDTEVFQAE
ncbi:MAG: DUF3179 domain-containing protein [Nitrospirales bacterium]